MLRTSEAGCNGFDETFKLSNNYPTRKRTFIFEPHPDYIDSGTPNFERIKTAAIDKAVRTPFQGRAEALKEVLSRHQVFQRGCPDDFYPEY